MKARDGDRCKLHLISAGYLTVLDINTDLLQTGDWVYYIHSCLGK